MKRITPLNIVLWSSLFVLGLLFAILAILVPFLAGLFWIFAILAWLGDAAWVTVYCQAFKKQAARGRRACRQPGGLSAHAP
jgi:hypothetical protein